jgi:hypothetical protein
MVDVDGSGLTGVVVVVGAVCGAVPVAWFMFEGGLIWFDCW